MIASFPSWYVVQDKHRQQIVDWIDATDGAAAAFDFTTKAVLQVPASVSACCQRPTLCV